MRIGGYAAQAAGRALFILFLALPELAFGAVHDLVIYHTNDVHGHAFESRDSAGKLTQIGYDRLKALMDADPSPRKLLLDAGDVLHGQSFAVAERGELAARLLGLMGYDALSAGNHDFDYGRERLLELTDKYRLKFISANIMNEPGGYFLPPCAVRSWEGLKVGIFGLATPLTRTSTNPRNLEGLRIKDPAEAAREMVRLLKQEGADLIIAVAHLGSEEYCLPSSLSIAGEVPGLDVIIDGHSHSIMPARTAKSGGPALVASTGAFFQNLGRVTADRDPEGGFSLSSEIISAASLGETTPDPALRAAMNTLKAEFDKEMAVVVMNAPFFFDGERRRVRRASTNLGRVICAALADAAGAEAALLNGGAVRASIEPGEVTKGELLSVLAYGNYVYAVDISGQNLRDAVNFGLGRAGSGAFPQFWGLEVTARPAKNGFIAESITIGGQPLDPERTYTLAINDFLYSGGDGYEMFKKYSYREIAPLEEIFRQFLTDKDTRTLKAISGAEVLKIIDHQLK